MDKFIIEGGTPLKGEVEISGSKNAALPIITACLLAPGEYRLHNIPKLRDVRTIAHLMRIIGAKVELAEHTMLVDTSHADFPEAPYELVKTMRASIYVLGPLLARFGRARVSLPGGCAWGPRPVDLHLKGMESLGAKIELDQGYINARSKRLAGKQIYLDVSSVGATGNIMMAATLAKGTTLIENAAEEPEIVNLGEFLIRMGAKIEGLGSKRIHIKGVESLHPTEFSIIPDRIESGTYLAAAMISRGEITLKGCEPGHLSEVLAKFREAGAEINIGESGVQLAAAGAIKPVNITTAVYPGYPTDMQAQWVALMSIAAGSSVVTDTIYSDRFAHVPELQRLGADVLQKGNSVFIRGVKKLKGAPVMSTDLRASASLVLAALAAEGVSDIHRVYHIDRGYEAIVDKLKKLGAKIERADDGMQY
ncbi:MAG: UDP-N-acetylglucosamine 1-carboxyvinyltransferase [Calditrichaceae bacterium]|nr:UDP-N-acetylglucosamine 1-carboxyvinyltransferase [Calditrichia bacterium]NUQ40763.1 UDP-N-acetylglucosamine 1-carboxyvinyltransferase [Calditrichaceae bacterium]